MKPKNSFGEKVLRGVLRFIITVLVVTLLGAIVYIVLWYFGLWKS
ncbi:hypothetical protein WIW50_20060 [Flavobacteriaceae bacterium 3-367]